MVWGDAEVYKRLFIRRLFIGDEGYAQSVADTFASALLEPSGSAVRPSRQQLDLFMTKLGKPTIFSTRPLSLQHKQQQLTN